MSAGRSVSVALAVRVSNVFSATVWFEIAVSAGAEFDSVTVIANDVSAVAPAPSLTRTVTLWVPGPSASPGVQVNTPVLGLIVAPVRAVSRL